MTAKMSRRVDPYIAYLVVAAKKALHDAGIAEGSDKMCASALASVCCASSVHISKWC
jgi:3-oxoacyl-(acyl-carrier-protein) synthase